MADDLIARELMRSRFTRLISELVRGSVTRTSFEPWEVTILLDLDTHELRPKQRLETLRKYQRAVERQLDLEAGPPMTLSGFLQLVSTRRPRIE